LVSSADNASSDAGLIDARLLLAGVDAPTIVRETCF
jgi:hypothetical protein